MGEVPGRVGIEDVEVAEGDAGVLLEPIPHAGGPSLAVPRALLVGILAVAQDLLVALEREVDGRRQRLGLLRRLVEPGDDGGVVGRRVGERLAGEATPGFVAQSTTVGDLGQDALVVGRVDDDADVGVVLGRGPHHRRPADVDDVDAAALVVGGELPAARIARRLGIAERVQVRDHQGDRLDLVLLEVGLVLGIGGVGEDRAVDLRVQRGDPVSEDRRVPGDLLGGGHLDASSADRGRRTAAGHQFPPERREPLGEVDHSRLVVHGQERPHGWVSSVASASVSGAGRVARSSTLGSASTARIVSG